MINCVLIGAPSVGKTSILLRYEKNTFIENTNSTIAGIQTMIRYDDKQIVFFDTAGQEKYKSFSYKQIQKCDVVCVVFDKENIHTIKEEITRVREYLKSESKIILVLSKIDLLDATTISEIVKSINDVCESEQIISFYQTSAKEETGLSDLLKGIASATPSPVVQPKPKEERTSWFQNIC